ncbi:hypothetical protein lerEdw1_009763 [Lerista edwardsae]|nr:hypothetical protein lerEdw1_009763 [Lerista edwardsae]
MEVLGGVALLLLFFLSCLLLLSTGQQLRQRRGMPPGPVPLPLVGNLLQIRRRAVYQSLMQIQEKYGPVYTLHLGARPVVILCGYEAVKEALVNQAEDFGGRGKELMFDWIFQGEGIPFCNGERAKQLRSFSITTLRRFSEGRRSLEERVSEEVGFLLGALRSTQGAPFDPTLFLSRSTSNVISSIMFGRRFDYADPEFLSLLRMTLESFRFTATSWGQRVWQDSSLSPSPPHFPPPQFYEVFSGVLAHLPGSHQKAFQKISQMREYIARKVKASEDTLDPRAPRGFVDCFLVEMQKEEKNPTSELSRTSLVLSILGIFFAGTEIVSSTLRYGLLMLLKYPEIQGGWGEAECGAGRGRSEQTPLGRAGLQRPRVWVPGSFPAPPDDARDLLRSNEAPTAGLQTPPPDTPSPFCSPAAEKLHEELDRVIGRSRPPKMEDLSQLPYTKAVLHEIQRHARMLPVGVARCVTRDTCFRGYTIPKVWHRLPCQRAPGLASPSWTRLSITPPPAPEAGLQQPTPPPGAQTRQPWDGRRGFGAGPAREAPNCADCSHWGTDVFPMLGSVLRDPKHFARPEAFDPERFLDQERQFKRSDAFLPFSIGKRACLGEHLAGMELFLFLTSILQKFRLQSPVPPEEISIAPLLIREKYGPVYTIHLGPGWIVVLCGYDEVKEALVDPAEWGTWGPATFQWLFQGYGHSPVQQGLHSGWQQERLLGAGPPAPMELLGALTLTFALCLACLALSTWKQLHRRARMPPGPAPLPLLGNLLQLDLSNMLHSLLKIRQKYGPVYTIHLGARRIVVLCGYDAVKEALVDQAEEFSDRGVQATFDKVLRNYGQSLLRHALGASCAPQVRRESLPLLLRNSPDCSGYPHFAEEGGSVA